MLPFQVAVALLTFIAASTLALLQWNAAIISYHVIFAIGIAPLILAAMIHFVPVLTRSRSPDTAIRLVPAAALLGGSLVASHFSFPQFAPDAHYIGAAIIAIAVGALANWAYRLRSRAIGKPHPCLDWYLAAMACLLAALIAILTIYLIPGQRAALRLLHLHLNTLGFIGITALGTLQVLLPTIAQRPDASTAARMQASLKWVVAGTIAIACGSAWSPSLAGAGAMVMGVMLIKTTGGWIRLYADEIFTLHGAAPALAIAVCGYFAALVLGVVHAYHHIAFNPVATFIIAFLMPLVSGAVSYLLPLWLKPGRQTTWHQTARKQLGFCGGLRALVFLAGGLLEGLGNEFGWSLALLGASTFFAQICFMWHRSDGVASGEV